MNQPGRGHYVYLQPPNRRLGNRNGGLGGGWGEVRGLNGIIVVAPTPHASPDGCRVWLTSGVLPELPSELANLLPDVDEAGEAVSAVALADFYSRHTGIRCTPLADRQLRAFGAAVRNGTSRHQAALAAACAIARQAAVGAYPAEPTMNRLRQEFVVAMSAARTGSDRVLSTSDAEDEFDEIAAYAVGQVAVTDLAGVGREVNWYITADPMWGGFGPAPLEGDGDVRNDADFWNARPEFAHIHQFALSRMVSPWAVLGGVLARVVAATPEHVVLPPLIGGVGSLNLFIALVGGSGDGKDAATSVAEEAVDLGPAGNFQIHTVGSGQGLAHGYGHWEKDIGIVRHAQSVVFVAEEIDHLSGHARQNASTMLPELRRLYMGQRLGHLYADPTRRIE
ncbi:MAG: hypothetical protein ACREX8_12855, partial [Gammaproteobacteria bacterium]